jgi:hypothetical protein
MDYLMSDDIRTKAEAYVDDYIVSVDERQRPSVTQRTEAIDKVEKYTRELLEAYRRRS